MKLSTTSLNALADAIAPDVFEELSDDGRYMDGIMNSIETAIVQVMGRVDPDLVGELGVRIIDKIGVTNGDCECDVWKERYQTLYRYVKNTYAESYVDGAEYAMMSYGYEDIN